MSTPIHAWQLRHLGAEQAARAAYCDALQPHLVGRVQPHGVLLHVSGEEWTVLAASQTLEAATGDAAAEVLGRPLASILSPHVEAALPGFRQVLEDEAVSSGGRTTLPLVLRRPDGTDCRADGVVYRAGAGLCLEFDLPEDRSPRQVPFHAFQALVSRVARFPGDSSALAAIVCRCLREMTGFDRAYYCEFDDDGSGYVPAEDRTDRFPSLLEHHFPASDIPATARRLYCANPFRIIPDSSCRPVPIVATPDVSVPLDLTQSTCREIAATHLLYLRNMGVSASASFSVVRAGRLAGLFGLHHSAARRLSFRELSACQHVVDQYTNRLGFLQLREQDARRERWMQDLQGLTTRAQESGVEPADLVRQEHAALATLMEADDVISRIDGHDSTGCVLPPQRARELLDFVATRVRRDRVYRVQCLGAESAAFRDVHHAVSGVLAIALDREGRDVIAWLRREHVLAQKWSGDPSEAVAAPGPGLIGPRASFMTYVRLLQGTCQPWRDWHLSAAGHLKHALNQLLVAHYHLRSRRAAEAANALKSEFIANISHELRSPMHAIIGLSDAMARKGDGVPAERRQRYVETIRASSERLLALINDLLDLSKLESGRQRHDFRPGDFAEMVSHLIAETEPLAAHRSVRIELQDDRRERVLAFDRSAMSQVMVNLLANAIRFSPAGGTVAVRLWDMPGGGLSLAVTDAGIGIPGDELETIFDKFVQSSKTKNGAGGTGLGLSICRAIVAAHGGRIWAENGPGGGAILRIDVPAGLDEAAALAA